MRRKYEKNRDFKELEEEKYDYSVNKSHRRRSINGIENQANSLLRRASGRPKLQERIRNIRSEYIRNIQNTQRYKNARKASYKDNVNGDWLSELIGVRRLHSMGFNRSVYTGSNRNNILAQGSISG